MPNEIPSMQRAGTLPRILAVTALAGGIVALLSVAACSPKSDDAPTASAAPGGVVLTAEQRKHIHIYTVKGSAFHKTVETTGVVDFDNDHATSVVAPFSGPVARLLVSPGDRVTKGQPLAVVDSPDFAAAMSTYRKALATAQTTRRVADMDKDLVQHEGVSRREEEGAQTDATNAAADRDAALQALVSLNVDPAAIAGVRRGRSMARVEGIIRAPIPGTVVEKLISPGQLLQAGTTVCFTVADVSRAWVMAQIFDSDLGAISEGDEADIETDVASNTISGKVTNISALVNPDTRSVVARVSVENPRDILKKQMYVRVRIKSRKESTGLMVPVAAILRDDENLPFVYVVLHDGSFARRHVTTGYRASDRFNITQGLRSGDRIVVDGAIFVQFMQSQ